jgi:hypothetical protein
LLGEIIGRGPKTAIFWRISFSSSIFSTPFIFYSFFTLKQTNNLNLLYAETYPWSQASPPRQFVHGPRRKKRKRCCFPTLVSFVYSPPWVMQYVCQDFCCIGIYPAITFNLRQFCALTDYQYMQYLIFYQKSGLLRRIPTVFIQSYRICVIW